jgi:hypothetical protein
MGVKITCQFSIDRARVGAEDRKFISACVYQCYIIAYYHDVNCRSVQSPPGTYYNTVAVISQDWHHRLSHRKVAFAKNQHRQEG